MIVLYQVWGGSVSLSDDQSTANNDSPLLLTEKPQHVTLLFKKDSSGPQRHAKNKKNWGGSSGNWET